jgi:hypothetical protein
MVAGRSLIFAIDYRRTLLGKRLLAATPTAADQIIRTIQAAQHMRPDSSPAVGRTLLGAAIGALLAMVLVPCTGDGYVLILYAANCRINVPQLVLDISFAALLGAIVPTLSRRALRRGRTRIARFRTPTAEVRNWLSTMAALWTAGILAILLVACFGVSAFQEGMEARGHSEHGIAKSQIESGDFQAAKDHLLKAADYWWWAGSWEAANEAKTQANDQASMERQYAAVLQKELEKQASKRKQEESMRSKAPDPDAFDANAYARGEEQPPHPSASSDKFFRQVDLSLVEPYSFTLNGNSVVWQMGSDGQWQATHTFAIDGWIRNKSSMPIVRVDIHIEVKNFAGDTFISETHTVKTQIAPGGASPVSFEVSDPSKGLDDKKKWSWHTQIQAAGAIKQR